MAVAWYLGAIHSAFQVFLKLFSKCLRTDVSLDLSFNSSLCRLVLTKNVNSMSHMKMLTTELTSTTHPCIPLTMVKLKSLLQQAVDLGPADCIHLHVI